jgi:hypothetical protein
MLHHSAYMLLDAQRQDVAHPAALAEMWRDDSGSWRTNESSKPFNKPKTPRQGHSKSHTHQNIQLCCCGVQ